MKYKCNNKNLKMRSLGTNRDYIIKTNETFLLVRHSRDKTIIKSGLQNYILERDMFSKWFEKV